MKWKVIRILSVNFSSNNSVRLWMAPIQMKLFPQFNMYRMLDSKFFSTKFTILKMWNSPNSCADKVRQFNGNLNMHTIMWNFAARLHLLSAIQTNKQAFISTTITMTWWRRRKKNHRPSMFFNINFCRYWYRKWKTWSIFKNETFS